MAKRMLIDAGHPEETRVVVLSGNRLEEFDYESASKTQLKGNIYLAKITRVEPSLQAAFVEYGGNRHGFLPLSEIHPDYYRIPIADRKALIAEEARLKDAAAEEAFGDEDAEELEVDGRDNDLAAEPGNAEAGANGAVESESDVDGGAVESESNGDGGDERAPGQVKADGQDGEIEEVSAETGVDTVGGDEVDDAARQRARQLRKYKIQEVIKRRRVILVQVTKEERGNKGAALTTYLSLAGRYCVLMPNSGKGGGISRKISNPADRRRLKQIVESLDIPEGVAVIVRTAGSERTKAEIRRDYEYLLRLWGEIRDKTLASTAPCLIYEEANLIKRAMRDLYQSDMEEILVEGEDGYKHARSFMRSLMPSHAKKVKAYKDPTIPLFYSYQVEDQIDVMHNATVQLKSGGYIVINMTEALVAIDVNSGKATRERHIEETAYKTNLEAAEEIARQLRLRDLAGLLVIDFIDMDVSRHNRSVERKLKEAMRRDRARIQMGRISPFGLLEMSRQRLRPSLFESSTTVCPNCNASGFVRTTESMALHILRGLEEEGIRRGAGDLLVSAPPAAALHLLNPMRSRIVEIERRYGFRVRIQTDDSLVPPDYELERLGRAAPVEAAEARAETSEGEKGERKRTRGRRRRRRTEEQAETEAAEAAAEETQEAEELTAGSAAEAAEDPAEDKAKRRRRRGKRGGRRRSRRRAEETPATEAEARAAAPEVQGEAPAVAADMPAEAMAEAAPEEAVEAETAPQEAAEATIEPKPRRRRTTRKRKSDAQPDAETAAQPDAETAAHQADVAAAGEAADAQPEAEAKPKRRRRASTAKRAPRNEKTTAKTKAEPSETKAEPSETKAEPSEAGTAGPGDAGRHELSAPEPSDLEPVTAAAAEAPAGDGQDSGDAVGEPGVTEESGDSRRRGWWQRFS